jgi:hypothetical protein
MGFNVVQCLLTAGVSRTVLCKRAVKSFRISQNNQIFTSDELGICLGSSHYQGSLDCRSQMVSGECFKGNGQSGARRRQ